MFSMCKIILLLLTIFLSPIYVFTRRLSVCKFMHLCWKQKLFIDRVYLHITGPELIFQQYLDLCHATYQETSFPPFISVIHIHFSTRRNVCISNLENSFWWKSEKFDFCTAVFCLYTEGGILPTLQVALKSLSQMQKYLLWRWCCQYTVWTG